ncbi:MAG: hypothetical protein ACREAZ_07895, partial [Nitrososphaera sp.]
TTLDMFDRVYYMRAILGVVAGIVAGYAIQAEFSQEESVGVAILIAIVFYIISVGVGKGIAKNVPKDKRRKVAMDGIVPFIFLLLTFMIIVYTALHVSILIK